MRLRSCCFLATCLFTFFGCRPQAELPQSAPTAGAHQSPVTTPASPSTRELNFTLAEQIRQLPDVEKGKVAGLLRAWKAVRDHSRYRIVLPTDFKFPSWVRKESYWSDLERATARPYDYGEMNGAYGLIAFIVDTTISGDRRYGVVVFIERPGDRYSLYWIYRDADLSNVTLNRHSGDVYLQVFRENGTTSSCDVEWSRSQGKWACDLN